MADEFNKFFVSAGQTVVENIKSQLYPKRISNQFSVNVTDCKHIKDIITSMASNNVPINVKPVGGGGGGG